MSKTLAFIKKEFLEMLPPTIYFYVVFHILMFTRSLIVQEYGLTIQSSFVAIIGALIVGKAILIADALPFVTMFRDKRLIYNLIWKTVLYASLVLLFQCLEELIPLISKYGSFSIGVENFIEETKWHKFWGSFIVFLLFLVIYNLTVGMMEALGRQKFFEVFLGKGKE